MSHSLNLFRQLLGIELLFITLSLSAQSAFPPFCASTQAFASALEQDSVLQFRHQNAENAIHRFFTGSTTASRGTFPYTLPATVHIIHNNGPENLSDQLVQQGIQRLNEAFANTGYYDQGAGVITGIQFCLAQRDPQGNPTTGITRRASPLTELTLETEDLPLKNLDRWNPEEYINIWIVREICSNAFGCGAAGYAYLPAAHGSNIDGIVIEARWLDGSPAEATVLVHEMGHYLGLYHTFEGSCHNEDCLLDGDRVCDTPPDQSTATVPCGAMVNSCTTDANSGFTSDQPDMYWNYMDYGDLNCYKAFTQDQTMRMGWHIENVRHSLLESPGCSPPCQSPIALAIADGDQSIPIGTTLNFNSTANNASNYQWLIDGQSFSTGPSASLTFNQLGSFTIRLTAFNDDPNCVAADSITVEVYCPVSPSFNSSNGYPLVGEAVSFSNTSSNSGPWQWFINNNPQSTNEDFSYTFDTQGIFTVCLATDNGLCEETFCQTLFVSEPVPGTGCEGTFIQSIGTAGGEEEGRRIISEPGGGFLLGGRRGDSTLICLLGPGAGLSWARTFKFTDYSELVTDMLIDSDGFLVVIGETVLTSEPRRCFALRYDYQNDILLWSRVFNYGSVDQTGFRELLEIAPGGNFLIAGQTWDNTGPGWGCDALLMEVNRNDGTALWGKNAHMGSCETYTRILHLDNALYAIGRYNFINSQTNRFRAALSKLELNGEEAWSRLYWVDVQTDARLYAIDIINDNGLVITGYGDFQGDNPENSVIVLCKTDLDGNVLWARRYDITGGNTQFSQRVLNLPDGYLIYGSYEESGQSDIFLIKTDKQGNFLWAKKYGGPADEIGRDLLFHNGFFHLAGTSTVAGGNSEIFFARLDINGNAPDGCSIVEPLNIDQSSITNPYQGYHPLDIYSISTSFFGSVSSTVHSSQLTETPACPPVPCVDTCDIVADAFWGSLEASCTGEGLEYRLEICNQGMLPLPGGTPVAFYDGDPTATDAALLGQGFIPQDIEKDSCRQFAVSIAASAITPVFVLINDLGTNSTPFSLESSLPNTEILECDFTNNLSSFQQEYIPPPLDLGRDTAICANGTAELNAGPGFVSYRWQDGSTQPAFTAFGPGTYWVEAADSCGGIQVDSIIILTEPSTQIQLPPDTAVCPGSTLTFSLDSFASYQWFPAAAVDCPNCPEINTTIDSSLLIIVVAGTAAGCYSVDSVHIELLAPVFTTDTINFCKGDTVYIFGQPATMPGDYEMAYTTSNGCDSVHTITLMETDLSDISLFPTDASCYGKADGMVFIESEDMSLQFSLDGANFQPASLFSGLPAGEHQLFIRHTVGCEKLASFHIEQPPELILLLPQDTSIVLGDSLLLPAQVFPADSLLFSWSPMEGLSCTDCLQPVAHPVQPTIYSLTAEDAYGCIVEGEVEVIVRLDKQVYIPNAFSPNGDGRNDLFHIYGGPGVSGIRRLRVFDRWGELVFDGRNLPLNQPGQGWDGSFRGQRLGPGTFVYLAEVEFINGQVRVFEGEVNLVR